ncbi:MAG: glycosyltransferase, partial [Gemmataceae bacterium]
MMRTIHNRRFSTSTTRLMRKAVVVSHLAYPHIGGVEGLVHTEILALLARGYRVTLLTTDGTGVGPVLDYGPHVHIVRIPAIHWLEQRLTIPYPFFLRPDRFVTIARELSGTEFVHAHGFLFQLPVLALLIGRFMRVKTILTDHGGLQQYSSRPATLAARL